jgi:hypothetical protein
MARARRAITGPPTTAGPNMAAAVAISMAMGPATVMPAKRQAGGTQDAIESVAQ